MSITKLYDINLNILEEKSVNKDIRDDGILRGIKSIYYNALEGEPYWYRLTKSTLDFLKAYNGNYCKLNPRGEYVE